MEHCQSSCTRTLHIHDAKCLINLPPSHFRTYWENFLPTALILLYMKLDHAFFGRYLFQGTNINLAQKLYVHWAALQQLSGCNT